MDLSQTRPGGEAEKETLKRNAKPNRSAMMRRRKKKHPQNAEDRGERPSLRTAMKMMMKETKKE